MKPHGQEGAIMAELTVRLEGLTKLDVLEIERRPDVRFEEATIPDGSHGEVTVFAAIFAMSALATLAAYLLRKVNNESFSEVVVITHPDGRTERRTVKWQKGSAEAPEAAIIRQIRGPTL
jgi:2-methylaconitate cis-trans-isomerase PrpF